MLKILFALPIIISVAFAKQQINIKDLWDNNNYKKSTVSKIKSTKKNLINTDKKQKQLNQHLSKIAQTILKAEQENRKLTQTLKKLAKDKKDNENRYNRAKKNIDAFKKNINTLDSTIAKQNSHFMKLLINQFLMMITIGKIDKKSIHSVIMEEIYNTYKQKNYQELHNMQKLIQSNIKKQRKLAGYQKKIEKSISTITKKRKKYLQKKAEKEKLLKKLAADEANYKQSIKTLIKKQSMIRNALAKLKIIHKEEIIKEKELEKAKQAEINKRAAARSIARDNNTIASKQANQLASNKKIKQVGSSYHKSKIYRYRSAKTISPLKRSKIVKSFGTYVDPIYNIKIFNESITLRSLKSNAKVRNVLNGKVVLVEENSMLGKLIIIEHANKLHTIYAGLSRISPIIKIGSRVKKGTIIGKINKKLIFEATKDSKYINPLRLIRL